jgi:subtilisin family serine protease
MQVSGLSITTATGSGEGVTGHFGGTSSATPLVAGVAALVLSANPELSAQEIASILMSTASKDLDMAGYAKTPPASFDPDTSWDVSPIAPFEHGNFLDMGDANGTWSPWFGHGRVDAPGAVAAALQMMGGDSSEEIAVESSPDRAIPDKNPQGVQDAITVNAQGNLKGIRVEVQIEYRIDGVT